MHLDTTARRTAQGQELLSVARTELGFLRDVLALWYVRLLLMNMLLLRRRHLVSLFPSIPKPA